MHKDSLFLRESTSGELNPASQLVYILCLLFKKTSSESLKFDDDVAIVNKQANTWQNYCDQISS